MKLWSTAGAKIILEDGRLVDMVAWRCLFQPDVPVAVVTTFVDDPRYRKRDWQVPLRLQACLRDTRAPPRLGGPLLRMVAWEKPSLQDVGDTLEMLVLSAIPGTGQHH